MGKLWLTYAWIDNENEDVDFIIQQLKRAGLDVYYDRRQVIPGQRLWPQIDKAITDPLATDAWGIYVTEHSLRSEPCQEELAYALDRALRTRGSDFPIIGIFPRPIDRSLIPSSIATRLYVNIQNKDWVEQVTDGVRKQRREASKVVAPFVAKVHQAQTTIELRPRAGRWAPFLAAVPKAGQSRLNIVLSGPADIVPMAGMSSIGDFENEEFIGKVLHAAITPEMSAFISFDGGLPKVLAFGQPPDQILIYETGAFQRV
jgi:TIR domain